MTPSFNCTFNTDSIADFRMGLKFGLEHKNGVVGSIDLINLAGPVNDVVIGLELGRKSPAGHEITFGLDLTKRRGPHQFTCGYKFKKPEDGDEAIEGFGARYTIGLMHNWGDHNVAVGIEGIDPYPYNFTWIHNCHKA